MKPGELWKIFHEWNMSEPGMVIPSRYTPALVLSSPDPLTGSARVLCEGGVQEITLRDFVEMIG